MPTQTVTRNVNRWYTYRVLREYCNGSSTDTGNVNYLLYSNQTVYELVRSWVRTPNYRALIAQKKPLPDNTFSWVLKSRADGYISLDREVTNPCVVPSTKRYELINDSVPTCWMELDEGARNLGENALRAKLLEKARGAEWSVPVFLGEARETIAMVSSAVTTLASAYRDLRRGNFIGAMASLGIQGSASQRRRYYREYGVNPRHAAANSWLSAKLGWLPFLSDVHNAATTLAELALDENSRTGCVRALTTREDTQTFPSRVMQVSPLMTARKVRRTRESCRGVWRFAPTSWNSWASFGLTNPVSVAWELLPASFLVDYLFPVGRYLEGLDTELRFDHLGGSIGYRRQVDCDYSDFVYVGYPADGTYQTRFIATNRTPLAGPPVLGIESVFFDPKLNASRVTTALALLSQVMRS